MARKRGFLSNLEPIFMHADGVDKLLMTLGFLGAVCDGISMPLMSLVTSKLINKMGYRSDSTAEAFIHSVRIVSFPLFKELIKFPWID